MSRFKFSYPSLAVLLLAACVRVQSVESKPPEPAAQLDTQAVAILRSAVDFIYGAKSYSATLSHTTTISSAPDKKSEFASKYEVSVERPNKLAFVIKDGKLRCAVLSDGQTLCTYAPPLKLYTQQEAPKTLTDLFNIDEMTFVRQDLNSLLFLDQFATTDAMGVILKNVLTLKIIGVERLSDNSTAYRLHFTEREIDWDMWIQDGKQPLVRKISIEGEQMSKDEIVPVIVKKLIVTQFDEWRVNLDIPAERFVFTPPLDAKKVKTFVTPLYDLKQGK